MSTVSPTDKDDPGLPLSGSLDELLIPFVEAEKPRAAFRVGTEHEKFGYLIDEGNAAPTPLPYFGERGIEGIFRAILGAAPSWTPATDGDNVVALFAPDGSSITLEPGGQVELSGAPVSTIHDTARELHTHLALLRSVCEPRGIGFIGLGFHPTATWNDMPMVPKARYEIMTRYMPQVGRRGLDMMKRTATVQANYDWSSEHDFVASYQAALVVAPLVAALFANGPFYEGKVTGAVSERQRVWADTDPARSGFPAPILREDFSYRAYVEWVLSVPMYFVRRDGHHHDVTGASFRTFMTEGLHVQGERVRATMRDWHDHLTTVFPEVRAKRVLEVRSADVGPAANICALPALYKGVLYDDDARAAATALMQQPTSEELTALRADVAVRGFSAVYRGESIASRCQQLVDIARAGLSRQARTFEHDDEGIFLAPLDENLLLGRTSAEQLVELFRRHGSLAPLWPALDLLR